MKKIKKPKKSKAGINTSAKGARRERQARDRLYAMGAYEVIKAGGSKGVFDLWGVFPGELVLVQVKSNTWPGSEEMMRLQRFPNLSYIKKLVWRYKDGVKEPDEKLVHGIDA